jgi:ATP-dependent DNA helicase RecG
VVSGPASLKWEDPVDRIHGLGPKSREALAKVGTTTVSDLLWTLPIAWDDARTPLSVGEAVSLARSEPLGVRVCFRGVVKSAGFVPLGKRRALRVVVVGDGAGAGAGGSITLWWFFAAHGILNLAAQGSAVIVTGRMRVSPGKPPRIANPDIVRDGEQARVVRPRYPRLGLPEGTLRKAIASALGAVESLPDFVPPAIALREKLSPVGALLAALHGKDGIVPTVPALATRQAAFERLAWAEGFARAWQRVGIEGAQGEGRRAHVLPVDRAVLARLRAELGFKLTLEQDKAIAAIAQDLAAEAPMRRLLFGDVGTGKTAVALAAAAQCVSAGAQVAILAPTSVLAEQYMDAVGPLARATGASVALIAAGVPAAQRRRREEGLARGTLSIAIGTHALLRDEIAFKKLGLVIVDEQHRLGVAQRLALVRKESGGERIRPHLLTLSATPIPRTLALALRGELKTSELGARPKGRPAVVTEIRPRSSFASILEEMRAVCARGERAFVIAPRIEEADEDDGAESASAVELAEITAKAVRPFKVGLIHGGLSADEKRNVMRAFRAGDTPVLVGTTVVEVGVDVPQATLIVIARAERFGLAQLHQLRGRVGRGDLAGRCILVHGEPLETLAEARLKTLVKLERGVDVAKADLALRGAGDLGGTRQSGIEEELLYIDPASPPPWLARVDGDARAIFAADPALARPEHRALGLAVRRLSVAIFAREEAG